MKAKLLAIVVVSAVFVQCATFKAGLSFYHGTILAQTEDAEIEYNELVDKVNVCLENGDYASAIPFLKRMHELMPQELIPVEYLGILYTNIPEEKPEFTNALFWLLEAEKRNSTNDSVYYNLACVCSLRNDPDNAVRAMDMAVVYGFTGFKWMCQDEDLEIFRNTPWWMQIADNYIQIENKLVEFYEFASIEN